MIIPIFGNQSNAPSTTAVNYMCITPASGGLAWAAATTAVRTYLEKPATVSNFVVEVVTAPGVGKSYNYILLQNGNNTALDCTISGTSTIATPSSNTPVYFAAGDWIALKSTPSGTPAGSTNIRWGCTIDTGTTEGAWLRAYGSYSNTVLNYFPIKYGALAGTSTATAQTIDYQSCYAKITGFYARVSAAPGGVGKSVTVDIYKNGVIEVTASLTISNAATSASVTGLNIAAAPGDYFYVVTTPVGTPTAAHLSTYITAVPRMYGETSGSSVTAAVSNTATGWTRFTNSYQSENTAADSNPKMVVPQQTMVYLKDFYSLVNTAPGASKSWNIKTRYNSTNMTNDMTISGAGSTTASDLSSRDAVFGSNDVSTQITPSGTPAAITAFNNYVTTFVPPRVLIM